MNRSALRLGEVGLAGLAVLAALATAWGARPPALSALYAAEIVALAGLGLMSVLANRAAAAPLWSRLTWLVTGAFLSLAVLGPGRLGVGLASSVVALTATCLLAGRRQGQALMPGVAWLGVGAVAQGIVMLILLLTTAMTERFSTVPA